MRASLAGQHVIITGGSSGIGKAIAQLLVRQGCQLSLIARDRLKLEQAQSELQTLTVNPDQTIAIFSADVAQVEEITLAIKQAIATIGPPDILIASAGIAHPGYFQELPLAVFEQTMQVNYFGALYSIRAALPAMLERQKGHLVLISSGAGLIGIYGYTPYCPSKFALRGLAESLRVELKPQGINVSVVYPPDTDTPQLVAENRTKPAETNAITTNGGLWSAEAVAQAIVRGIATEKFAIAPGTEMRILNRLHSLLNPLLQHYFDRLVRQVQGDRS